MSNDITQAQSVLEFPIMRFFSRTLITPRLSYIICCNRRTGSTLLCEALKDTGVAGMPAEYIGTTSPLARHQQAYLDVKTHTEYLEKIIAGSTTPNGVFGTKIHPGQLPILLRMIQTEGRSRMGLDSATLAARFPNLHYIWLARENKVRQAISLYRALRNSVWWKFEETMPPMYRQGIQKKDPEFDLAAIARHLAEIRQGEAIWEHFFQRNGITPLFLTYEGLSEDLTGVVRRVLDYLELPSDIPDLKLRTARLADTVTDDWERKFKEVQLAHGRGHGP